MSQIVIGTAGHIDHGKTSLVKALTGTDTDRLAEEKARGMTIDLGFAYLTPEITIIDVPGHEKFIRNMVAGVATVHIALLVVAADDGVMPQTREHIHILELLGIPTGIIALTKTDLVEDQEWLDLVELDVREIVQGTFLENAPVVRTSVYPGQGLTELKKHLIEMAGRVQQSEDRGFFRLPVDRAFTKKGFGVVVTGTVLSGHAKVGDELEVLPQKERVKIRGIQSHGENVEAVAMGDRAALNLVGTERGLLKRGMELAEPGWMETSRTLVAEVVLVPDSGWELKHRQRVHVHLGTGVVLSRVQIPDRQTIKPGQKRNVIFHLEESLPAAMDDRFIIRSYSPMVTLGGCIVLDPYPNFKGKDLVEWVSTLAAHPEKRFLQLLHRFTTAPRTVSDWARIFHRSEEWVEKMVQKTGACHEAGLVFLPENFSVCQKKVLEQMNQYHRLHPYQKSVSLEYLEQRTGFSSHWLSLLLRRLGDEALIKPMSGGYALAGHEVRFSGKDQERAEQIRSYLSSAGFNLHSAETLSAELDIPVKKILELLHVLKDQGIVVEIMPDLWLPAHRMEDLLIRLKTFFKEQNSMSVAEFKTITETTRKATIPLLEYCDRMGWTERRGDHRIAGGQLN